MTPSSVNTRDQLPHALVALFCNMSRCIPELIFKADACFMTTKYNRPLND